jgi:hypothetical protein
MTEIQPKPRDRTSIKGPSCPKCQIPLELFPVVPGLGHLAHRIFECGKCGYIQIAPE